jgi:hypothetical protein
MSTFDIHAVAAGDYSGAPTVPELRTWAKENGVEIDWIDRFCHARLDGCGGIHKTSERALHLLYHTIHVLEGHVSEETRT